MHKEAREELRLRFKLLVLELATHFGPTKTCRDFEVPNSTFYEWKKAFKQDGVAGLKRKKPIAVSFNNCESAKYSAVTPSVLPIEIFSKSEIYLANQLSFQFRSEV